jgi:hypothetical protein
MTKIEILAGDEPASNVVKFPRAILAQPHTPEPGRARVPNGVSRSTSRTKKDYLREAQAANPSDPIRALIEAYKQAHKDWEEVVHFHFSLYDDDPRYEKAQLDDYHLGGIKADLLNDLLIANPTTIAGVIDLAECYCEVNLLSGGTEVDKDDLARGLGNLARSLKAIAAE